MNKSDLNLIQRNVVQDIHKEYMIDGTDLILKIDYKEKGEVIDFDYGFCPLERLEWKFRYADTKTLLRDLEDYKKICYAYRFDKRKYFFKFKNEDELIKCGRDMSDLFYLHNYDFSLWRYPNLRYPISVYRFYDDIHGGFREGRFKIEELYEYLKKEVKGVKELKMEEITEYNQMIKDERMISFYYRLKQKDYEKIYDSEKNVEMAVGGFYKELDV